MDIPENYKKRIVSAAITVSVFLISIRLILLGEGISPQQLYQTIGSNPWFIVIALVFGTFVGLSYLIVEAIVGKDKKSPVRWMLVIIALGLIIWVLMTLLDCRVNPESCPLG